MNALLVGQAERAVGCPAYIVFSGAEAGFHVSEAQSPSSPGKGANPGWIAPIEQRNLPPVAAEESMSSSNAV